MSQSDLSSLKQKSPDLDKNNPAQIKPIQRVQQKQQKSPEMVGKTKGEEKEALYEQNRKLRKKLKQLSFRLDDQLQKAAQFRLKHLNQKNGHPVTLQSQNLQLQNAYKMIQRLQKTVKDYEGKQAYQVTLKRVMDLEGIIKKKQSEIQELKTQIKTQKKIVKDKERYIEELIQNSKKMGNPTEDLQTINKLKIKMKKMSQQNQILKRKQMQKHQKMVSAERKITQMEQNLREHPTVTNNNNLQKQLEQYKNKYKDAILRIERQNIYISKLNQKLHQQPKSDGRKSEKHIKYRSAQRKNVSFSLDQLPELKKKISPNQFSNRDSPHINKAKLKKS